MLNCRKVADIVPAKDWTFSQRLQLKAHLLICKKCRALRRQFAAIDEGLHQLLQQASRPDPALARVIAESYLNQK